VIARNFYRDRLGHLVRDQPDLAVSGVFYVVYVGGIVLFAISPALQSQSWATALVLGILLGVIAYGTYDMTNLATLRGWPVALSAVDLIWGSALTACPRRSATWRRAGRAPRVERGRRRRPSLRPRARDRRRRDAAGARHRFFGTLGVTSACIGRENLPLECKLGRQSCLRFPEAPLRKKLCSRGRVPPSPR
jgi:uncharacterized membrane protein